MSVIVKGINKCISCEFCIYAEPVPYTPDSRLCIMTGEYTHEKYGYIPEKCPVTELPKKHGRLIDADALMERLENEMRAGLAADTEKDEETKRFVYAIHKLLIEQVQAEETVIESEGNNE